jgi:hypothetical protein
MYVDTLADGHKLMTLLAIETLQVTEAKHFHNLLMPTHGLLGTVLPLCEPGSNLTV